MAHWARCHTLSDQRLNTMKICIGLDFGSDSVRALAVDASTGQELACCAAAYPRWARQLYSNAREQRFRHHPLDYIEAFTQAVQGVVAQIGAQAASQVVGIGVDATGSTPAPIDAKGRILALRPEFAENPNAMFVLWKDHTAIAEADAITALCHSGAHTDYTRFVGGTYSSEWWWAKILHVSRADAAVRRAAASWVELCDWVPGLLTDRLAPHALPRSRCAAGHKALWNASWGGLPSRGFLHALDPLLVDELPCPLFEHSSTADEPVGLLTAEWAARLGLPSGVMVSGGAFDCHMGAVGAGARPQQLVKVIGTSTCDILIASQAELGARSIEGICGQVDGSVMPGWVGLEAGQSAFGDLFAWVSRLLGWSLGLAERQLPQEAAALSRLRESLIPALTEQWAQTADIENLPLMLDWINGRRTPGANQRLQGVVGGLTLGSEAPDLFGAALVAAACGSRAITECFESQALPVDGILAIGGIPRKSPTAMQVMADVLNRPIDVAGSDQCCALGAAVFAAVAAGVHADVQQAQAVMASRVERRYEPDPLRVARFDRYYRRYQEWARSCEPLHEGAPA